MKLLSIKVFFNPEIVKFYIGSDKHELLVIKILIYTTRIRKELILLFLFSEFWSLLFRIRTKYEDLHCKSLYSDRIHEILD